MFILCKPHRKKECSQDQVLNENCARVGSKMGEPQHKKSVTIFHVLHKDEKPMTFLSNTFMVTITQDDSKMQMTATCTPG